MLVSSHLMSELEDTADHLVIVGRGKVIADTGTAGCWPGCPVAGHGAHHGGGAGGSAWPVPGRR